MNQNEKHQRAEKMTSLTIIKDVIFQLFMGIFPAVSIPNHSPGGVK